MGHLAGGVFAQMLAAHGDPMLRAIDSHGAAAKPKQIGLSSHPIPLALYAGENDHLFPPQTLAISAQALADAGRQVKLFNIPDHTHWYYQIGPQIAPHMWQSLTSAGQ